MKIVMKGPREGTTRRRRTEPTTEPTGALILEDSTDEIILS